MSRCALPFHLQDRKHNDWPWPLSYLPRSINAKGPRCGKGYPGYLPWPPKLIEGKGVSRWETSRATSIVSIPEFEHAHVNSNIYGREVNAIESMPGHPEYGKSKLIKIEWKEQIWPIDPTDQQYHPSALQQFSKEGWMKCDPYYYASWKRGSYFYRWGWRMDSLDCYYNFGPYLGGNYE